MTVGSIAVRYAKALLTFVDETGKAEEVYREALKLKDTWMAVSALQTAMNNPLLAPAKKSALIEEALGGKITAELRRFVRLVPPARMARVAASPCTMKMPTARLTASIPTA